MSPRRAIRTAQKPVCLFVTDHLAFGRIPAQAPAQAHGEIGQNAGSRRDATLLDVRYRFASLADGLEEVLHVPANRRGAVLLQILLRLVFRVFVVLVKRLAAGGRL